MWTKFDDRFMDRQDVSSVSRNARLLLVEAYIYCNRNETDGEFKASEVRKFSDLSRPAPALKELMAAGLLDRFGDGVNARYALDWSDQPRSVEVEIARQNARLRKQAQRLRTALHEADIHTDCGHRMYCKRADYVGLSQRDAHEASRVESHIRSQFPDPTRPDPSRPDPEGRGRVRENGTGANAPADAPRLAVPESETERSNTRPPEPEPVDYYGDGEEIRARWHPDFGWVTVAWLECDPWALDEDRFLRYVPMHAEALADGGADDRADTLDGLIPADAR